MWRKLFQLMVVMTAMTGLAALPACEDDDLDVDTPAVDRDLDLDNDTEINRVEPVTPQATPDAGDRPNVTIEPGQAPTPPAPEDQPQPGATTPSPGATTPQP